MLSEELPACPECAERYTYEQGGLLVCPMCGHEWSPSAPVAEVAPEAAVIRDAVGNELADGDTVTVIRDLRIKGRGAGVVKVGTRVRGIRLLEEPVDGHDIDATVPGFGRMQLKSSVVRKA